MLRHWSIYRTADGQFTGQRVSYPASENIDAFVAASVADGFAAKEGTFDHLSQRVESSGEVVDYQPPRPDDDHEWIHDDARGNRVRRWMLKPAVIERRNRVAAILAELAALDAQLIRPLGELASEVHLEPSAIDKAQSVIAEVNKQKAALRAELHALQSSSI